MENASPRQRDGEGAAAGGCPKAAASAALEAIPLKGAAAFERDCLSVLLDEWPARASSADLFSQAEDLIAEVEGDHLATVRRIVGRLAAMELAS